MRLQKTHTSKAQCYLKLCKVSSQVGLTTDQSLALVMVEAVSGTLPSEAFEINHIPRNMDQTNA